MNRYQYASKPPKETEDAKNVWFNISHVYSDTGRGQDRFERKVGDYTLNVFYDHGVLNWYASVSVRGINCIDRTTGRFNKKDEAMAYCDVWITEKVKRMTREV